MRHYAWIGTIYTILKNVKSTLEGVFKIAQMIPNCVKHHICIMIVSLRTCDEKHGSICCYLFSSNEKVKGNLAATNNMLKRYG